MLTIKFWQGSAVFLVFDKFQSAAVNQSQAVREDSAREKRVEGLLWPPEGLVLPRLALVDVEWHERARGAMTKRQGQREREVSASDDGLGDGAWDVSAVGECALLLVDGVEQGRACGGAGTVDISQARPGPLVVSIVPVRFASQDDSVDDKNVPWVLDAHTAARSSRVWIEGRGHGNERTTGDATERGVVGSQDVHIRPTDKVTLKVVGLRGAVRC